MLEAVLQCTGGSGAGKESESEEQVPVVHCTLVCSSVLKTTEKQLHSL